MDPSFEQSHMCVYAGVSVGSSQETRKGPWVGEEVFSGKRVGRVTEGVCKWKWKKIGEEGCQ